MRRREFIGVLGGVMATWPLVGYAQQRAGPVVGFLSSSSSATLAPLLAIFRQSLLDAGPAERNVTIEHRWAEGQHDRLPALAAELVRRQVDVIVATANPAALAAKAASATVPVVFSTTDDPVQLGLVASIARPAGNATGVRFFLSDLGAKQLGLLRELVPGAVHIGLLVNPSNPNVGDMTRDLTVAASTLGVQLSVVRASDSRGIESAFETFARTKVDALVVGADPFFFFRRLQLATLATRHGIPAVYNVREYAEAGGLMTYGTSLTEVYRQLGAYAGRILKGDRPADLPVVQSTRFELVINVPTARALGIDVPPMLLARADEVIE